MKSVIIKLGNEVMIFATVVVSALLRLEIPLETISSATEYIDSFIPGSMLFKNGNFARIPSSHLNKLDKKLSSLSRLSSILLAMLPSSLNIRDTQMLKIKMVSIKISVTTSTVATDFEIFLFAQSLFINGLANATIKNAIANGKIMLTTKKW